MTGTNHPIPRSIHCPGRYPDGTPQPILVRRFCGSVRDDEFLLPDRSPAWMAVKSNRRQSGKRLHDVPFILTHCPDCFHHGQKKGPASVSTERAGSNFGHLTAWSLDELDEGLIALIGTISSQVPGDQS